VTADSTAPSLKGSRWTPHSQPAWDTGAPGGHSSLSLPSHCNHALCRAEMRLSRRPPSRDTGTKVTWTVPVCPILPEEGKVPRKGARARPGHGMDLSPQKDRDCPQLSSFFPQHPPGWDSIFVFRGNSCPTDSDGTRGDRPTTGTHPRVMDGCCPEDPGGSGTFPAWLQR
jgi:hypothetical protein